MGATTILALCRDIQQCDAAIAFNPLVNFVEESRLGLWFEGHRLPRDIQSQMPQRMAEQCCDTKAKVFVHYSKGSKEDMDQLAFFQEAIQARLGSCILSATTQQSMCCHESLLQKTLQSIFCKEKDQ